MPVSYTHLDVYKRQVLTGIRGAGPLLGAVLGCVPQCGFSVLAANLFSGGMISAGTLLAVFLSTSDEAILMIMGQPESAGVVGKLLLVKVVIAVLAGYLIDFCFPKLFSEKKEIHDLCEKESCGCGPVSYTHLMNGEEAFKGTDPIDSFCGLFDARL